MNCEDAIVRGMIDGFMWNVRLGPKPLAFFNAPIVLDGVRIRKIRVSYWPKGYEAHKVMCLSRQ